MNSGSEHVMRLAEREKRNVGQQTVQVSRNYMSPQIMSHHKLEKDDYNQFFYTPRTISTIGFMLITLNLVAHGGLDYLRESTKEYFKTADGREDPFEETRFPVLFASIALLGFAITQFPGSYILRPHPAFWRLFMGLQLGYAIFMTLIFLLPKKQARETFRLFHPDLGLVPAEKNYAADCRVFTPEHPVSSMNNLSEAVFDVHFVAHLAGWWFKMMIIRDTKIAWIISGSFELIEISWRHLLPNFWECWWDHVSNRFKNSNFLIIFTFNSYFWTFSAATCSELSWVA